jgi:photosystem II stability/assembly factor-like uncharacterized protein
MGSQSSRRVAFAAVASLLIFSGATRADEDLKGPPVSEVADTGGLLDVLDKPSMPSALAAKKLLVGMTRAGNNFVAVGPRGHIVVSKDGGQTWVQAKVPVSSDLTAVYFASESHGWAVGHDGVVLVTTDGGATWTKQLDGRGASEIIARDVKAKLDANPESEELQSMMAEAQRDVEMGPDKPFLDVWFEDDNHGFIVGAYNLILETKDGGQTWTSWFDRVPNPQFMSLYAIRPIGGELYMAGEQGVFYVLDRAAERFVARPVDYQGTLFGIIDAGDAILTYGIKGNLFRSTDGGVTWIKVDSQLAATIVGGAELGQGTVILADQGGRMSETHDGGQSFAPMRLPDTVPLTGIINAGDGRLGLIGQFGVAVVKAGTEPAP